MGGAVRATGTRRVEQANPFTVRERMVTFRVEGGSQRASCFLLPPGRGGPALDGGPAQRDGTVVVRFQCGVVGGEPGEELPPGGLVLTPVVPDGGGEQRPGPLVVRPGRRVVRQTRDQRVDRCVRVGPRAARAVVADIARWGVGRYAHDALGRTKVEQPAVQPVGGDAVDPVVLGDLAEYVVGGGVVGAREVGQHVLIGDDAVDGVLDLRAARAGHVERFQVLDRIRPLGDLQAAPDNRVEVDEPVPREQGVHVLFTGAVPGREPLQRVRLIRRVVVDVRPRVVVEPSGRPVDEPFERAFLSGTVVCPERVEDLPGFIQGDGAEQVLQPGVVQRVRIPLHVEVDVARVRYGQGRETVRRDHPNGHRAGPVVVGAGRVLDDLQFRL